MKQRFEEVINLSWGKIAKTFLKFNIFKMTMNHTDLKNFEVVFWSRESSTRIKNEACAIFCSWGAIKWWNTLKMRFLMILRQNFRIADFHDWLLSYLPDKFVENIFSAILATSIANLYLLDCVYILKLPYLFLYQNKLHQRK